jgi:hypothetical protein
MMHHQSREHHIKRLVGEGKLLDHPDLKIDGEVASSRSRTGASNLLCSWIHACDAASTTNTKLSFQRELSRAAAHIQHHLSGLHEGETRGSLPELAQLATKQEGVHEPYSQVIAPALVKDQPFCLLV